MVEQTFQDAIKAIPFLKEVSKDKEFVLSNGEKVKSLIELQNKLSVLDDKVFRYHVTNEKNDFATWVYHAIGDHELASKLGPLKDKAQNLAAVKERVRECATNRVSIHRKKAHA